ncbi:MAG TPA: hypothetical protein VIG30_04545 [Ktedonobacterales bacterium]|jgi:hypothetical protein
MTDMPELDDLRAAVSDLYATFARYPLRARVTGCAHCVDESDNRLIHSRPLRELTWHELARFSWKTLTTWGDADDLRHFLPRLFELIADQADPAEASFTRYPYNEETLFGKLDYADWRAWPTREQAALDAYFMALWHAALAIYPSPTPIATWLGSIGAATDPAPYLAAWRADERAAALRHLADFVLENLNIVAGTDAEFSVFWQKDGERSRQVAAWLRDPQTRARLERGFFAYADERFAANLSEAVQYLG